MWAVVARFMHLDYAQEQCLVTSPIGDKAPRTARISSAVASA